MDAHSHWQDVYGSKDPDAVSWYRPHLEKSLQLIGDSGVTHDAHIVDVGTGAATLVDDLLALGYSNLTLVDISERALAATAARLGDAAGEINWVVGDITTQLLPEASVDFWHDRAVFHFLTDPLSRTAYVEQVTRATHIGSFVSIATFAPDGPSRCSGLEVQRYAPEDIGALFAERFGLVSSGREVHLTPKGSEQPFSYALLRRER